MIAGEEWEYEIRILTTILMSSTVRRHILAGIVLGWTYSPIYAPPRATAEVLVIDGPRGHLLEITTVVQHTQVQQSTHILSIEALSLQF
jgi:hypothetical protein